LHPRNRTSKRRYGKWHDFQISFVLKYFVMWSTIKSNNFFVI
jgi:hypothetical protein